MEIKISTLQKQFTTLGLLFFCGYIGFLFRMIAGNGDSLDGAVQGSRVNQLVGITLLLVCLFLGMRYKTLVSTVFWRHYWPLALFIGSIFASIIWSIEPGITLRKSFALMSMVVFTFYLVQMYSVEQLFRMIGLIMGGAAVLGLILAIISPSQAFVSGGLRGGAFVGIFSDKNAGARAYAAAIIILLPFSLKGDRQAIVASLCSLLCILLAQSASAVLLLLIGGSSAIYFKSLPARINKRANVIRVALGLIVFLIISALVINGYQLVLEMAGRDATLTDRTMIWKLILPLVWDRPVLGYGFGAFWTGWGAEEFIERWGFIGNAHNGYIELMLHGGILMLSLFLLLCLLVLIRLLNKLITADNPWVSAVSIAIVIQMLIANFIAYTLPNHRSFDFFIFLIVATFALKATSSSSAVKGPE